MTSSRPEISSLRERSKAERRKRILEAASLLIRESGSTDFSMQDLAGRAGISLATTYNLIGVKAAVLYELLDRSLDVLGSQQAKILAIKALAPRVEEHAIVAARHFGSDADYHRPLMRYLLGAYEPERRPLFMGKAHQYWQRAFVPQDEPSTPGLQDAAEAMHIAFTGALDIWVHHEVSSEELEARVARIARLLFHGISAVRVV